MRYVVDRITEHRLRVFFSQHGDYYDAFRLFRMRSVPLAARTHAMHLFGV